MLNRSHRDNFGKRRCCKCECTANIELYIVCAFIIASGYDSVSVSDKFSLFLNAINLLNFIRQGAKHSAAAVHRQHGKKAPSTSMSNKQNHIMLIRIRVCIIFNARSCYWKTNKNSAIFFLQQVIRLRDSWNHPINTIHETSLLIFYYSRIDFWHFVEKQ